MDSKSTFMASLSKEHLSLGLNVSLNDRNEIIIIELEWSRISNGSDKKGDQIISISNLKKTLQVSCNTLEAISYDTFRC
jgi:carboxyl-terminal processing protease